MPVDSATLAEIRTWPAVVPLYPHAARALGLGRSSAYALHEEGRWPTRTMRLGRQIRVPLADLLTYLGAPVDPVKAEDPDSSPASGSGSSGTYTHMETSDAAMPC